MKKNNQKRWKKGMKRGNKISVIILISILISMLLITNVSVLSGDLTKFILVVLIGIDILVISILVMIIKYYKVPIFHYFETNF